MALNRRGVSGAAFVGLFSVFIPVPSQMLLVRSSQLLPCEPAHIRCTGQITNPITIPPMIYGSYRVGAWVGK